MLAKVVTGAMMVGFGDAIEQCLGYMGCVVSSSTNRAASQAEELAVNTDQRRLDGDRSRCVEEEKPERDETQSSELHWTLTNAATH